MHNLRLVADDSDRNLAAMRGLLPPKRIAFPSAAIALGYKPNSTPTAKGVQLYFAIITSNAIVSFNWTLFYRTPTLSPMPAAPAKRAPRRLYPIGAGTRFAIQVERCPSGIVALHQNANTVILRQQDLYQVASALADWVDFSKKVAE